MVDIVLSSGTEKTVRTFLVLMEGSERSSCLPQLCVAGVSTNGAGG
jgi:hypothetical protein